ncbi:MAG: inositol monophosphatase family protein [Snowella sp.]|nr:inositol monophosphatase family protein [Snowella sp.]
MNKAELAQRLQLAHTLADLSGEVIRQYFRRSHLASQTKTGESSSIVTIADQAAEQAMVEQVLQVFPEDGIIREEGENQVSKSGYYWVIDPIDGTSSFVKGLPIFGTLIGLVDQDGTPVLGIADQPIIRERWQGVQGELTRLNGQVLTNPYAQDRHWPLAEVCLTSTTPLMFVTPQQQAIAAKLQQVCKRTAFGGDCYNYLSLAAGWTAMPMVILESDMKYYDFCALIPIIQGSGGIITDWQGRALDQNSTEVLAASNAYLHQAALEIIQSI